MTGAERTYRSPGSDVPCRLARPRVGADAPGLRPTLHRQIGDLAGLRLALLSARRRPRSREPLSSTRAKAGSPVPIEIPRR
jgi:hypothetical protein